MISNQSNIWCFFLFLVHLHESTGRIIPARGDLRGELDHQIGGVFQRAATTKSSRRSISLASDIRSTLSTFQHVDSASLSSVRKMMIDKLTYCLSKLDEDFNDQHQEENHLAKLLKMMSARSASSSPINISKMDMTCSITNIQEMMAALHQTEIHSPSVPAVQVDLQERHTNFPNKTSHNDESNSSPPNRYTSIDRETKGMNAIWEEFDSEWPRDRTALELAVRWNALTLVEQLIKDGADCWTRDGKETLLHQSIRDGTDGDIIQLLMAGCDVNATEATSQKTALHLAAEWNRLDIVEPLLRLGANIEAQDSIGFRPLHLAVRSPRMVTVLLQYGAYIEATTVVGMRPLHLAVIENQYVTAKVLVEDGAKVGDARDIHGSTPLDYAIMLEGRGGSRDKEIRDLLAPYALFDEKLLDIPSD